MLHGWLLVWHAGIFTSKETLTPVGSVRPEPVRQRLPQPIPTCNRRSHCLPRPRHLRRCLPPCIRRRRRRGGRMCRAMCMRLPRGCSGSVHNHGWASRWLPARHRPHLQAGSRHRARSRHRPHRQARSRWRRKPAQRPSRSRRSRRTRGMITGASPRRATRRCKQTKTAPGRSAREAHPCSQPRGCGGPGRAAQGPAV